MVDALYDEGGEDWTAAAPSQAAPAMQMQAQDMDAFADADFASAASPVVTIQTASGATQNLDDDLTEEEKEIVAQAAAYQDKLKAELHEKMMAEAGLKQERKNAGYAAITQFQKDREGQIQLRKQNNQEHERQFHTKREDERQGNPWERVTDNCDLTLAGVTAGGKDKTRMKQAILNRKADVAAGGQVVGNFGSNTAGL